MNNLSKRSFVVIAVFTAVGLAFLISLFRLQVLDPTYKQFATNNVLREVIQYPARGLVYDRNGKLLVFNKAAYDLLITPREVGEFDTLSFCKLLEISKEDLDTRIQEAKQYSRYKPSILIKQILPESFAVLQEQLYKYPGFHTQSRILREYTSKAAAHALGYVSEVGPEEIQEDNYYRSGDYIGESGIEKNYENKLRGTKGVKKYLVDVHNRIQGSYQEGKEDLPAKIGKNLISTLDMDLQLYAEKLLQNKKGSVVAIEPSTGEILAMASFPTYDPGLLVGRVRGNNYAKLLTDPMRPLYNRALSSNYPPGSTFKTINALIALQEKAITENTRYSCAGRGSVPITCTHDHVTPLGVIDAIEESCNPFMWNTFRSFINKFESSEEGYNRWREYLLEFGIGKKIGIDLPNENSGNLPSDEYYNNIYGKGHWNALTIRSLAIGQGELGFTPLQIANYCAIIANRGYYYVPHIVKEIKGEQLDSEYNTKINTSIEPDNFRPVIRGMELALQPGSSTGYLAHIPGIIMCGKTGSIQNPHGAAHSAFIAFAPKENPQIAILVYIENGVWGARYAAPIASLMVEKYLTDTISPRRINLESRMINANLLNPNQTE